MVVAICGSSGLIGTAVKQALEARDCRIVPVTRTDIASGSDHLKDLLDGCDALVNLAGVSIAGRWTEARKKEIYESRVLTTRRLVEAVNSLEKPLADFITASAVGIYDSVEVHDEFSTSYASGFLADLCIDWEHEALKVDAENTRLTIFRLGVVLSASGGMLKKMLPPFRLGLGARIGKGDFYMPWIHIDDVVKAIVGTIFKPIATGVYNLVAPEIVTSREFTLQLAAVTGKAAYLTLPAKLVSLVMGEASQLLLEGQQVIPQRLLADGFEFSYPTLESALRKELIGKN